MDFINSPSSQLTERQRAFIEEMNDHAQALELPIYSDLVVALAGATGTLVNEDAIANMDEMVDRASGFDAAASAKRIASDAMRDLLEQDEHIGHLKNRMRTAWNDRKDGWCERQADAVWEALVTKYDVKRSGEIPNP